MRRRLEQRDAPVGMVQRVLRFAECQVRVGPDPLGAFRRTEEGAAELGRPGRLITVRLALSSASRARSMRPDRARSTADHAREEQRRRTAGVPEAVLGVVGGAGEVVLPEGGRVLGRANPGAELVVVGASAQAQAVRVWLSATSGRPRSTDIQAEQRQRPAGRGVQVAGLVRWLTAGEQLEGAVADRPAAEEQRLGRHLQVVLRDPLDVRVQLLDGQVADVRLLGQREQRDRLVAGVDQVVLQPDRRAGGQVEVER